MFIPVGKDSQGKARSSWRDEKKLIRDIWQIDKDAQGEVSKKKLFGVMVSYTSRDASSNQYVPLTDASKQWSE